VRSSRTTPIKAISRLDERLIDRLRGSPAPLLDRLLAWAMPLLHEGDELIAIGGIRRLECLQGL
jgi:hypothetical protein